MRLICRRCSHDFPTPVITSECEHCWDATSAEYPAMWPGTGEAGPE